MSKKQIERTKILPIKFAKKKVNCVYQNQKMIFYTLQYKKVYRRLTHKIS